MDERRLRPQPEDEREEDRLPPPGQRPCRARPGGDGEDRVERQKVALADVQRRENREDTVRKREDREARREETRRAAGPGARRSPPARDRRGGAREAGT